MIALSEASKKMGVTQRRLRKLCADGRVIGAQKLGGSWIVPDELRIRQPSSGKINIKL